MTRTDKRVCALIILLPLLGGVGKLAWYASDSRIRITSAFVENSTADPWGSRWGNANSFGTYSPGPNKVDDWGEGDDVWIYSNIHGFETVYDTYVWLLRGSALLAAAIGVLYLAVRLGRLPVSARTELEVVRSFFIATPIFAVSFIVAIGLVEIWPVLNTIDTFGPIKPAMMIGATLSFITFLAVVWLRLRRGKDQEQTRAPADCHQNS